MLLAELSDDPNLTSLIV